MGTVVGSRDPEYRSPTDQAAIELESAPARTLPYTRRCGNGQLYALFAAEVVCAHQAAIHEHRASTMALAKGLAQRKSTVPGPHSLTPPPDHATSVRQYSPDYPLGLF